MTSTLRGASVIEQELYDYICAHIESESAIVNEYRDLVEQTDVRGLAYVAQLILADEQRHHTLLASLAESIKASAELGGEQGPIPAIAGMHLEKDRLLGLTDRLLRVERQDLKELKELTQRLKDYKDTTLWKVIVESMQDDTRKHIRYLEFIRDHLRKPSW